MHVMFQILVHLYFMNYMHCSFRSKGNNSLLSHIVKQKLEKQVISKFILHSLKVIFYPLNLKKHQSLKSVELYYCIIYSLYYLLFIL